MKRVPFDTGQAHQAAVAAWARRRLADGQGTHFDDGHESARQWGCLFADGVGLGKTWEALAATALILAKSAKWSSDGSRRERQRRRQAHVLILTPPGLVSKWSRELRDPNGFSARLEAWTKGADGRDFVQHTLGESFELRRRSDVDALPRGRIHRRRYALPSGTYVCNWNVFLGEIGPGRDRISALRRQEWDVLIVDEAHHARAREALGKFTRYAHTLLLSATPFQLDPTELHLLTEHLMEAEHAHKLLSRGAVAEFVKAADLWFEGGTQPTSQQRRAAEHVLGQLVARSQVRDGGRRNFVIDESGRSHPIPSPTSLGSPDLPHVFSKSISPGSRFREWYLGRRLKLASLELRDDPQHVAMELRKLLSTQRRAGSPVAPRADALRRWAEFQLAEDLRETAADGIPRKLLVFTHFVQPAAGELRELLGAAFRKAYATVRRDARWRAMRSRAEKHLDKVLRSVLSGADDAPEVARLLTRLRKNLRGTPFFDLFGHRGFAKRVEAELLARLDVALSISARESDEDPDLEAAPWLKRQERARQRSATAVLEAIARAPLVATYTGDDERTERESNGEAFRTPLAPWILVASNVGSEGIDLHTYGRHLVHFDVEWNPARMEQREGRIDRLGRVLKKVPVSIYYLLVRETYDERMFHQLVARQRWHGVLLGRSANRLSRTDETEARLISARDAGKVVLNLQPRGRS